MPYGPIISNEPPNNYSANFHMYDTNGAGAFLTVSFTSETNDDAYDRPMDDIFQEVVDALAAIPGFEGGGSKTWEAIRSVTPTEPEEIPGS